MNENVIPSTTFKVHFNTLKSIADKLQDANQEPDIDELVEDVKKATLAYQACKERLTAAKEVLEAHLSKVEKIEDNLGDTKKESSYF